MRKITRRAVTAVAAAATILAVTVVPTSAAPATWTVTPGGHITMANLAPLRMWNTSKGVSLSCPVSTFSGTMPGGTGLPGTGIATLTNGAFIGCVATMALNVTITPNNLPWSFNAVSYDPDTGVTSGTLTGFLVTAVIGNPTQCTVTVGGPGAVGAPGTLSVSFDNVTSYNAIQMHSANLKLQTASGAGCGSLYVSGDDVEIWGGFGSTPPNAPHTITSP